jgi:hypothetical protein
VAGHDESSQGTDELDAPMSKREDRLVLNSHIKARKNGLWLPVALTLKAWSEIGMQIAAVNASSAWWLGDWLIYGKKKFPDRYKQAIIETSLDYQTLRNYAWVCRRFPVTRRRAALSFQHHAELASLSDEEQTEWLDKSEALGWSLHELRRQLKAGNAGQRRRNETQMTFKLAVPVVHVDRWRAAAAATGVDTEEWIVSTLDNAAAVLTTSS